MIHWFRIIHIQITRIRGRNTNQPQPPPPPPRDGKEIWGSEIPPPPPPHPQPPPPPPPNRKADALAKKTKRTMIWTSARVITKLRWLQCYGWRSITPYIVPQAEGGKERGGGVSSDHHSKRAFVSQQASCVNPSQCAITNLLLFPTFFSVIILLWFCLFPTALMDKSTTAFLR